jgi:hypothetical protein
MLTVKNTILAGNTAGSDGPDVYGPVVSAGYNLIGDSSGDFTDTDKTDLVGTSAHPLDPRLGPLQDNGGAIPTIAVLPGSPAINAGDPTFLNMADQRGVVRTGGVNIGAYQASASTFRMAALPSSLIAGTPISFSITASDLYGNTAIGYRGTVQFSSGDRLADLPHNYTFTAADNGIQTSSVTFKTAGPQSLSVRDTTDNAVNGTEIAMVDPAAASRLMPTGPTHDVTAGTAFLFTVRAVDPYGNTATGYRGTILLSGSDSQAVLPEDYTFTAADNGVHTFGVTFKTAGPQSLSATDTTGNAVNGTEIIMVDPAAASRVVLTGPSSITAGTPFIFVITAFDPYGNTATGYRGTIRFNSRDSQADLPGKYTFTATDQGVHTFGITFKTAGPQSVSAMDTTANAVNGTEIVMVDPAAASLLKFGGPSSVTAGTPYLFRVTAFDPYGNVATGFIGTIRFSSRDSQADLSDDYTFTAADQGLQNFRVTFKTAGAQSLSATERRGNAVNGTEIVMVEPAAASLLKLGGSSSVTAGTPFIFVVTAFDPYGNLATGYRGTFLLSSSDGQPVVPKYTFTAADSGGHAFSVALTKAETLSLTATDMMSSITSTPFTIAVNPAAASLLTLGGSSSVTAGTPYLFSVTAVDSYNNTATGYRGTILLRSNDTDRQAVQLNYIFTASDSGVHPFSVTLTKAETLSLTATDTMTRSITSTPLTITINPAAASQLVLAGPTHDVTAGTAFLLTARAVDLYGNTATGYRGTVEFSSDLQEDRPNNYTFPAADSGEHTFSVTLTKAEPPPESGPVSLTATDISSKIAGTIRIMIIPAAAHRLIFADKTGGSITLAYKILTHYEGAAYCI